MQLSTIIEVVKKNLFPIICGVIALLAFIAWFWPYGTMADSLHDDLKTRVDISGKIKGLKDRARLVPGVGVGGKPEPLTHFPNAPTITAVENATTSLKDKAKEALAYAVALNHEGRELLEPGSLPAPVDNTQNFRFRAQYNAMMDYGGKPEPWDRRNPGAGPLNLLDQVLNATPVATQQDVDDAKAKIWESDYHPKVFKQNGIEQNLAEIQALFDKDTANFVKEFHQKRASQFRIYCEADTLPRAPRLSPQDTPSVTDIWFAQMTLWVEQDVCETIRQMNEKVTLVPNQGIAMSPVKNLIELQINPDIRMYVLGQALANPGAPALPELDPSTKMVAISPTGRVCNSLYDVVSFHVTAIILPSHLPEFLERLRNRRMLTVTSMSVQDVDWKAAEDLGYFYGPARCVQVSMDCEELFMRDWTVRPLDINHPAPMPAAVQAQLGIPAVAPVAVPAPGKVAMQ